MSEGKQQIPGELRQEDYISSLTPTPTEWVTVWASDHTDDRNGGVQSYLTTLGGEDRALTGVTWSTRGLGETWVFRDEDDECLLHDGLSDGPQEFFLQVRSHHDLAPPSIELALPFLWFTDAIPRPNRSWFYLSGAGSEHELVRASVDDRGHGQVEVAAIPLRRFLAAGAWVLVLLHDWVVFADVELSDASEVSIQDGWRHFELNARSDGAVGRRPFSRLLGKSLVFPLQEDPCEESDDYLREEGPFPEFIYALDQNTGQPRTFTCQESELSNYFVIREGAPHYLTPVYFRPEVLSRYTQQPGKYTVVDGSVSCLDLWSLRADINPEGLVEVFLGDLGKYLPPEEREYWRSFNVPPRGGMSEARFRRDFLAQIVEEDNPIAKLREVRHALDRATLEGFARPFFQALHPEDQSAWTGLHLMTTNDVAERDRLTIVLAKALVDAIDVRLLRDLAQRPDGASLEVLEGLVVSWGGDPEICVAPLRLVQAVRSSASAHIRGTNYVSLMRRSGLDQMPPRQQFESLVRGATGSLAQITTLIVQTDQDQSDP